MGVSSSVNLTDILLEAPKNLIIQDCLTKAHSVLSKHEKVVCSISGGSDSDVMLDVCTKLDPDKRITYVWINTGIEYLATKEHLDYLEQRYGIQIQRLKAKKSVPLVCITEGQPFLSKQVSEFMWRLQSHNFDWSDRPFEELAKEYPNCLSALKWWCNEKGGEGIFNINHNKWLKEFIVENPPTFKIANKCCKFAKKDVIKGEINASMCDLNISGVRKNEGGVRATAYSNCFDNEGAVHSYRPLFWFMDSDKAEYCKHYKIVHSKCYTEYGLSRTGCVGCPFALGLNNELDAACKYEPQLYKAVCNIFKDSYEYTRRYKAFVKKQKSYGQISIFDIIGEENGGDAE